MDWTVADVRIEFDLEATEGDVVTADFDTPVGLVKVMASIEIDGCHLVARGLHIHGVGLGPGALGVRALRILVNAVMERLDVDHVQVEGARRTTGANPGHRAGILRFSRKAPPLDP